MTGAAQSPRLVIDTNVLVPGVVGAAASPPAATASASLLRVWRAGSCSVVVGGALLEEYQDMPQRAPFGLPAAEAARYCRVIGRRALRVAPLRPRSLLTRDRDDLVFRTALARRAPYVLPLHRPPVRREFVAPERFRSEVPMVMRVLTPRPQPTAVRAGGRPRAAGARGRTAGAPD